MLFLFVPPLQSLQVRRTALVSDLRSFQKMLHQKKKYEVEWNFKKVYGYRETHSETALNMWVRDLLSQAQAQGLVLTKMEPHGIAPLGDRKEMELYLLFDGSLRTAVRFLFHLLEADPFSRIKVFRMKQNENGKNFVFEMILGRIG
ncbi:MAG: hypothetical protein NC930_01250 [Candidatus Omnitrophica bacterium]|nr:hypothetical protein [Candidatus Omnitrophota bacterium]